MQTLKFITVLIVVLLCCIVNDNCVNGATTTRPPVSDEALDYALNDKRYLMRQLKCALGEAPCDPIGKRLKSEYKPIPE